MISLLWQDSVLSLLDQSVYPQEERWLTCTSLEETVQVLSSGAILEEKIAAQPAPVQEPVAGLESKIESIPGVQ